MKPWTAFDIMHTLNIMRTQRWVSNHRREWESPGDKPAAGTSTSFVHLCGCATFTMEFDHDEAMSPKMVTLKETAMR